MGAGITLQPTGLSVLRQLGLLEEILAQGSRIDWLDGRTKSGRIVLDLKYQSLHPALFGLGIHRGALFQSLYSALPASGVAVKTGATVESYSEREDEVWLEVNGAHYAFDLLVIADGARSALRSFHPAGQRVRRYDWGALWTVVPAPQQSEAFSSSLIQVFDGTRRFVGFLPTGLGPQGSEWAGEPIVSIFWSIEVAKMDAFRGRGAGPFRDEVLSLTERSRRSSRFTEYVEHLLASVDSSEQLLPAMYLDVVMERPHSHRVVFLGDAAHAMSPQLGQGANLALYDAWVLSQALLDRQFEVPAALSSYARERRSHLTFYQWATRLLTPFFQSNFDALGWARDLTMGGFCRWPFFSRQGLGSMAGYKCGVFDSVPVSHRLGTQQV